MNRILDLADAAYWWLSHHVRAAIALGAGVVALLVVLFLVTGDSSSGGKPKVPAGDVALVGDTPITSADLTRWQGIYTRAVSATAAPTATEARDQAFELLAGSAWIDAEARRTGVKATDAQITQAIDAYFQQSGASTPAKRTALLKQLGIAETDLRFQQRVSLLSDGLRRRAVKSVTAPDDAAVKAAYARDPERWATPTKRDLRVLITPDRATADKAKAALDGGTTFAAATQTYSTDAALARSKGVVSGVLPGANVDAFDRPVFRAPQGQLQGPIKVEGGWMLFKVQKITPLPPQTLAQATKLIKANGLAAAQKKATDRFLADLRTRWRAQTTCTPLVAQTKFCRQD